MNENEEKTLYSGGESLSNGPIIGTAAPTQEEVTPPSTEPAAPKTPQGYVTASEAPTVTAPSQVSPVESIADRAANATADQAARAASANEGGTIVRYGPDGYNETSYADMIRQQYDSAYRQQANTMDYQTDLAANKALRTYEDSIRDYQKQYRNVTRNMYQGMDNAALEARAAGRFGGMATAQVGAAQSRYQQQRQELALQQQKLATDTVREIEDLRAKGEFDKADALLKSRQQEFQALYEDAVRVDENRWNNYRWQLGLQREDAEIQRDEAHWQTEINRNDAEIQRENEQFNRDYAQKMGLAFLNAGIMPPESMLEQMGLTDAESQQALQSYIWAIQMGL